MDVVDSATRSKMMSGIKSINTQPERMIRSFLHNLGFRYKIHNLKLSGKPDIVLPKYRAAIFINGCFWHGHNCYLFKWPKTRPEFWQMKIKSNIERDLKNSDDLLVLNWRVLVIWECAIRKKRNYNLQPVLEEIVEWILGNKNRKEITYRNSDFHEDSIFLGDADTTSLIK